MVKNPPVMREAWIQPLGREDPLEREMATHSSILAGRIPMDREAWWAAINPWGRKELDTTEWLNTAQDRNPNRKDASGPFALEKQLSS